MKPLPLFLKIPLLPFAWLYDGITSIRNWAFDNGRLPQQRFRIPIINVGNLSVGGTGKTPHVEYIANLMRNKYVTATLSRGYKRKTTGLVFADHKANASTIGDEPMQYYFKFNNVTVAVCEKRVDGAKGIIENDKTTRVIILDDAYQHRYIKPDVNILLTDYKKLYVHDYLMPYGSLRENKSGAERAQVIIVTKCPNKLTEKERNSIIARLNPENHQQVYFTYIKYCPVYDFLGLDFEANIAEKKILLITGIANNDSIIHHLRQRGNEVNVHQYPDHHYFSPHEIDFIKETYDNWDVKNKVILTTEKDIVRLALHFETIAKWNIPIYVLPIEIDFIAGKQEFDQYILKQVNKKIYG